MWPSPDGKETLAITHPKLVAGRAYPMTPRRVYRGKNLEAVGMPMGGIGTGSIWLDGRGQSGRLADLQQPQRTPHPRQLLRRCAPSTAPGQPVTRVLQTKGEGILRPVESLEL